MSVAGIACCSASWSGTTVSYCIHLHEREEFSTEQESKPLRRLKRKEEETERRRRKIRKGGRGRYGRGQRKSQGGRGEMTGGERT
jgi:hypothetical protein